MGGAKLSSKDTKKFRCSSVTLYVPFLVLFSPSCVLDRKWTSSSAGADGSHVLKGVPMSSAPGEEG